ncbi:MAG: hypothetical protein PHU56_03980 [Candidatus Pacebacteria bacterium]|nr:hypothetical protein [Candidatus Paceibacterota bacterium]
MKNQESKSIYENTRAADWDMSGYKKVFGFEENDLRGKKILDIGGGKAAFQEEALKSGIDVVSIDPLYGDSIKFDGSQKALKAAAVNEALPFQRDTFDLVLANCSSFYYIYQHYLFKQGLEEAISKGLLMLNQITNVLRDKGEAMLSFSSEYLPVFERILEEFKKNNSGTEAKIIESAGDTSLSIFFIKKQ